MEDPQAATFIERAIDNHVDELVLVKSAVNRREAHDTIRDTVEDLLRHHPAGPFHRQSLSLLAQALSTPYQE